MKNKDIMAICAALVIASLVLIFLIRIRKDDSYSENSFRVTFVGNWIEILDGNGNDVEPSKALKLRISKQDAFWLVEQLDKDGTYKPYPETTNGKYEGAGVLTCLGSRNYFFFNEWNGLIKDQNYHYFKSVQNFDESITKHQPEIKEGMTLNNQENKYWYRRDSIREGAIRSIVSLPSANKANYKPDVQNIKERINLIDSLGASGIYKRSIFCEVSDKIVEVKNNQWPEAIKTIYNILKTPSGKIAAIIETPYDEHQTGDWRLLVTHYFDNEERIFAFVRLYIDYTGECFVNLANSKKEASFENVCEYYDTHFSKISRTREVIDSKHNPLDGSKCVSPDWVEKYKAFPTVESLLKSMHI